MKKIESYLKSFNDNYDGYAASDTVIEYLCNNFPEWKSEIKNSEEWESAFEFDIHVIPDTRLSKFADSLFNIIDNVEAEIFVWNNSKCNSFYRYQAIKRLRRIDEKTYLPQYIEGLRNGEFILGGWAFTMTEEIFDFSSAVSVATEICEREGINAIGGTAFEYLSKMSCANWAEYPEFIKEEIISHRNYFIFRSANADFWSILSEPHKFQLVYQTATNEIFKFRELIALCQYLDNPNTTRLMFDTDVRHMVDEMGRRPNRDVERMIQSHSRGFDYPVIDINTNRYTPSERMNRLLNLTNNDNDRMLYKMLNNTIQEISHLTMQL